MGVAILLPSAFALHLLLHDIRIHPAIFVVEGAVSPIIRSARPKAPAAILSSKESAYLLSDICNPYSVQAIVHFLSPKTLLQSA